jgi:hypothetical protein
MPASAPVRSTRSLSWSGVSTIASITARIFSTLGRVGRERFVQVGDLAPVELGQIGVEQGLRAIARVSPLVAALV